jgi:hypothetical protein
MNTYLTFGEYLVRRSADERQEPLDDPVAERSISGGMFKAVNPARPVSSLNSRLLTPTVQKRFKSQLIGR